MKRWSIFSLLGYSSASPWRPPRPRARTPDTLVVVQEAEPVGLDLMQSSIQTTMSVCYNIHDTLFHPQEDATVLPALAEKWEKVDDLTWKITLRKDAVFHNGEPVNAAAVKFSYDRINNEELKSPNKGKLSAFTELNVIDDYTFTVKTEQPYAPGLYMLGYYLPIVPPKYIQEVGDEQVQHRSGRQRPLPAEEVGPG